MPSWSLTIPGEAVAKGRPRLGTINGHARAFTPANTRSYESEIRALAHESWSGAPLLDGIPLTLTVDVFRSIPASWSQKKQAAARAGDSRPMVKPDVDNFAKTACDALNGIVFRDDALVVDLNVRKFYAMAPRLDIGLTWV